MKKMIYLIIFLLTIPLYGAGTVYLDISGATFKRIPVAVPKFIAKDNSNDNLSLILQKELVKALNYTDLFEIIGEENYLGDASKEGYSTKDINFDNWKTIGVELLIKGNYKYKGDVIIVEIRAFDPYQAKFIFGRRYKLDKEHMVKAVYKFVNELLKAITGKKGVLGSKIAFQYRAPGSKTKDIYIMNSDGTNFKRITSYNRITMFPAWFPNGKKIVFSGFVKSYPDIFIANLLSGKIYPLVSSRTQDIGPRVSPNGEQIAFSSSKNGNSEIYTIETNRSNRHRVTFSPYIDVSPTWSPDGEQLAFISNRAGNPHLYVIRSDGGSAKRITFQGKYISAPDWSPDNNYIAFSRSDNGSKFDIYLVKPDGSDLRQLTSGAGSNEHPRWSSDGRYLVFTSNRSGHYQLYIINVSSGKSWRIKDLPGDAKQPAWSKVSF